MNEALVDFFKHNLWANLRLLDFCSNLSDDQLDAGSPGTYGRLRDTLVHLCAAEERYVSLLTGQTPERPLRESEGFSGFDELARRARLSGEALIELAAPFQPDHVLRGSWREGPYAIRAVIPVIQAINHATEHRAHVATILGQQGLQPPDIDGWAYGEEGAG